MILVVNKCPGSVRQSVAVATPDQTIKMEDDDEDEEEDDSGPVLT